MNYSGRARSKIGTSRKPGGRRSFRFTVCTTPREGVRCGGPADDRAMGPARSRAVEGTTPKSARLADRSHLNKRISISSHVARVARTPGAQKRSTRSPRKFEPSGTHAAEVTLGADARAIGTVRCCDRSGLGIMAEALAGERCHRAARNTLATAASSSCSSPRWGAIGRAFHPGGERSRYSCSGGSARATRALCPSKSPARCWGRAAAPEFDKPHAEIGVKPRASPRCGCRGGRTRRPHRTIMGTCATSRTQARRRWPSTSPQPMSPRRSLSPIRRWTMARGFTGASRELRRASGRLRGPISAA